MARIAVAVSGGADSLFALLSLRDAGHDVLALHGRFLPPSDASLTPSAEDLPPVPALRAACAALDVPLHVVPLADAFDENVIAPFVRAYAAGRTPNPCAQCNRRIKFGALLDAALRLEADSLATGHYAALREHPRYGQVLIKAADSTKDQSYFLSLVPQERLRRACFPLADVHKKDAVAALTARGVTVPLPQESQEICFVPQDRYRPFLEAQSRCRGIALGAPGPMLLHAGTDRERCVGQHNGLWQYTEGQRRGLGVAHSEPLYVLGKDHARNALLLAEHAALCLRRCTVTSLNLLVSPQLWPSELYARVRYRQQPALARCTLNSTGSAPDETTLDICFSQPQSPTAPGQIAALYDEDGVVLAGGVISATAAT